VAFRDAFPILQSADLERAVAFYTERLGFDLSYGFPESDPVFVVVTLDSFSLGLARAEGTSESGRVALWLYCNDVDAELDALRAAGIEVVKEPADTEWGERMASVLDPDGNEVFLGQRLSG
jgi:lactoylglutathione lyase